MKKRVAFGILISVLLVLVLLVAGCGGEREVTPTAAPTVTATRTPPSSAWTISTVDSSGEVGRHTSITLDGSGNPHISYWDYTNDAIKYAHWNGSSWNIQTIDKTGTLGLSSKSCIVLDKSGNPHISYGFLGEPFPDAIKYAQWNGSSWNIYTVDDGALQSHEWSGVHRAPGWNAIGVDESGNIHISYYVCWLNPNSPGPHGEQVADNLNYAHGTGATWAIQTIDSRVGELSYCSLALDSSGNPHISYQGDEGEGNYSLRYAHWNGSSWEKQTVTSGGYVTSIALDASGHPHISYWDSKGELLKYAHWDGSSWNIQTVERVPSVGWYSTSIALDASGHPYIAYQSIYQGMYTLKYACGKGSSWDIQTVDSDGDVGYNCSIAIDGNGNIHISYYDATNGDLKYAKRAP